MKHPLKQMTLPFLPDEEHLPETYEELKGLDPEVIAYMDAVGKMPDNPPEGSEKWRQFAYTGRKKIDKDTLQRAIDF